MRSLSVGNNEQPLLPIDTSNDILSSSVYKLSKVINDDPPHFHFNQKNNKISSNSQKSNNDIFIQKRLDGGVAGSTPTKSRVPDILMINKYYGLVPQKFAISLRKSTTTSSVSSTPSSASCSGSGRASKTSSSKPNAAKPSILNNHHHHKDEINKSAISREWKGHKSDNDSPELIKRKSLSRNGSIDCESSDENFRNPFGPVTRRMSVEKHKKWRYRGGSHRGINLNMPTSIGQTLSILDNGNISENFQRHAKRRNNNDSAGAGTDYLANRRVIKIDLNKVSQEEENFEIQTSPERDATINVEKVNNKTKQVLAEKGIIEEDIKRKSSEVFSRTGRSKRALNFRQDSNSSVCSLSSSSTEDSNNGCFITLSNNVKKDGYSKEFCIETHFENNIEGEEKTKEEKNEYTKESIDLNDTPSTLSVESPFSNISAALTVKNEQTIINESLEDNKMKANKQNHEGSLEPGKINLQCCKNDCKVISMKEAGKLSQRTISFDESLVRDSPVYEEKPAKKRPTTAAAVTRSTAKTFTTLPNNFNPPSKVVPWTQQKTAGGKPLTLAERRAKFQRAPSIHSSSSQSMETGGEEELLSEEIDNSNVSNYSINSNNNSSSCCTIRPPSSAFRDTRKPLYVMQPPEVPTMISQISPNADENIQIEIEKVALMLRKMQSLQNFSRSLDSGIEAYSSQSSKDSLASSRIVQTSTDTEKSNLQNANFKSECSNSSPSFVKSNDLKENSLTGLDSSGSPNDYESANTKLVKTIEESKLKSGEVASSKDISIVRRLYSNSKNNESAPNDIGVSISSKKITSSPSLVSLSSSSLVIPASNRTTTVQRPPLKKAVSISCEQELLKTGDESRRNGVTSSPTELHGHGRTNGRPRTAVANTITNSGRNYGTGTRPTASTATNNTYANNNCNLHRQNSVSPAPSNASSGGGSQGSRNRKILIKKALMEVNQSSANLRRKWGTLGRPRTAPSSEKSLGNVSQQHPNLSQQQRRKPLKASPFPISGNGRMGPSPSGNSSFSGGGKSSSEMEGDDSEHRKNADKAFSSASVTNNRLTSQIRANSECSGETSDKSDQQSESSPATNMTRGRSAFRQSFSLDESALLGFSMKSMHEGRMPIFEKLGECSSESGSTSSILNDDMSFLTSKKREQCLKVYEKMMKTGCTIKLDTVFRGLLTPSEYRTFMRAAEKAAIEAEEELDEEEGEGSGDPVEAVKENVGQ